MSPPIVIPPKKILKKLVFKITEPDKTYTLSIKTDRSPEWTRNQYLRNRSNIEMVLISEESY